MKKVVTLIIVGLFILCSNAFALEKTKDRASSGMDNLFLGQVEVPKNLNESKSKGTKLENCTEKTRDGVERGIARTFTGAWKLLTFWYSDQE